MENDGAAVIMDKGGDSENYAVTSDLKVSLMEGPSINPDGNPNDSSILPISIDTNKYGQLNVMDMAKLETQIKNYKPKSDILKA